MPPRCQRPPPAGTGLRRRNRAQQPQSTAPLDRNLQTCNELRLRCARPVSVCSFKPPHRNGLGPTPHRPIGHSHEHPVGRLRGCKPRPGKLSVFWRLQCPHTSGSRRGWSHFYPRTAPPGSEEPPGVRARGTTEYKPKPTLTSRKTRLSPHSGRPKAYWLPIAFSRSTWKANLESSRRFSPRFGS